MAGLPLPAEADHGPAAAGNETGRIDGNTEEMASNGAF